jgi:hypothetical protein
MRSIYQLPGGNGKHFKPLLHIAHNMWTLILITVVSMNPPVYYYNPLGMTDTLAECEAMAANIRREESLKAHPNSLHKESGMNENDIVYRLRKRAEIRRQIPTRKSVQENQPDRIADLLEEAANEIEILREKAYSFDNWMYKEKK